MPNFLSPDFMTLSEGLEISQYNDLASFLKPLEKKSKFMQMCPWFPSSDGNVHKGSRVTSLPEGKHTHINGMIPTGHMSGRAYEETQKLFELESVIDSRLLNGSLDQESAEKLRMAKDAGYLKGYMQSLAKAIMLSDGKDVDAPVGFMNRRSSLSDYCLDMGGTASGKLGSLYFIRFGEDGVNLRYPKSFPNAFEKKDMGLPILTPVTEGNKTGWFYAYHTLYSTYYMPDIADDNALIRAANIPTDATMSKTVIENLIEVVNERLTDEGDGYICLGPNRLISQFQKYLLDKNNIYFSQKEIEGMGKPNHLLTVPLFAESYLPKDEARVA